MCMSDLREKVTHLFDSCYHASNQHDAARLRRVVDVSET